MLTTVTIGVPGLPVPSRPQQLDAVLDRVGIALHAARGELEHDRVEAIVTRQHVERAPEALWAAHARSLEGVAEATSDQLGVRRDLFERRGAR